MRNDHGKKSAGFLQIQDGKLVHMKTILDNLYACRSPRYLQNDPLSFCHRYPESPDQEIVGLIASSFAYGKVHSIKRSVEKILAVVNPSPLQFIESYDPASARKLLTGFKHRFNDENDISDLIVIFKKVLAKYSSLEKFFLQGYNEADETILPALEIFCDNLIKVHNKPPSRGLGYLLCKPSSGSPCKRLNLFLRWMVRSDEVDLGIWPCVNKAKLIIPVAL